MKLSANNKKKIVSMAYGIIAAVMIICVTGLIDMIFGQPFFFGALVAFAGILLFIAAFSLFQLFSFLVGKAIDNWPDEKR